MKKLLLVLLLMSPLFSQVEGDIKIPFVDFTMKKGKGVYTTRGMCNMCHSFGYVLNQGKQSREFWMEKTVKMIKVFNAPISAKDVKIVVDYLSKNYGDSK